MNVTALRVFQQDMQLRAKAECLLGSRPWSLLQSYGKLMGGPWSGRYVSALPAEEQLRCVERLIAGETLNIHLMHRHRSGIYAASALRWDGSRLIMVFDDVETVA